MLDVPFSARLTALLGFLAVMAVIDRVRLGAQARRWHEYTFLLSAGIAGSLFALANDQLTVTISADYFVYGKGLELDGLRWGVTELALQAGLTPGLLTGGALLLVNQPRDERLELPYRRLVRAWLWPLACAIAAAVVVAPLYWMLDPFDISVALTGIVPGARIPMFLLVQGIHTGLYLGGAIGLVVGARGVWRHRAASDPFAS